MRRGADALVVTLLLAAAAGCTSSQQETAAPQAGSADRPAASRPMNEPPARKAILEALFTNLDVKLSVHPSCSGVGAEADDETIGDYLAGFIAEFTADPARNWIDTSVASAASTASGPVWRSDVMLRHSAGDDEWGWGVRFDIRKADGLVLPDSFQCLGAG